MPIVAVVVVVAETAAVAILVVAILVVAILVVAILVVAGKQHIDLQSMYQLIHLGLQQSVCL
jgi:hypothetical protein